MYVGFFSSLFKSKSSPAKESKPAPAPIIEVKLPTPNSYNAGRCPVDPVCMYVCMYVFVLFMDEYVILLSY
jgi:hypothetical protein